MPIVPAMYGQAQVKVRKLFRKGWKSKTFLKNPIILAIFREEIKWKYKREKALNLKIRKQPTETFVIF